MPDRPITWTLPASPDSDGPADPAAEGEALAAAMERAPSPGTAGRMELLHHWRRLSAEKRVLLLMLAREMAKGEAGE
ncbi:hypothetical protein ACE7GA_21285 [Roseomonas sp. CCTCC AB2023176]|uniref:hypothetical protein n=1 Tax=Roseomonas sp. CCTCC AB2023176 TaxID=3342640 RepID=UPI0035E273B7